MSTIELYLIRHGLAGERGTYPNDDERPLTEEGRQKTHKIAKRLKELGLHFEVMLTSPLVRARQTADLLMEVKLADRLEEFPALGHGGDLQDWLTWFESWRSSSQAPLALVGHEPDLTTWAETLLWGRADDRLILKKAGVIGLLLPPTGEAIGNSQLFWLAPPRLLL